MLRTVLFVLMATLASTPVIAAASKAMQDSMVGDSFYVSDVKPHSHEIVFVDEQVPDRDTLISNIRDGIEVIVLDANQDGVSQITSTLQGKSYITALHIISHGNKGEILIGNGSLNAENLKNYSSQLFLWSKSLTEQADILLYGCNVGGGSKGKEFIDFLAISTGTDVAASDDITGVGGNWILEQEIGLLDVAVLENPAYQHNLVIPLSDDSTSWIPVLDGLNFDPGNDYQAGGAGELVGTNSLTGGSPTLSLPLFYTKYDDKGTPATADDEVAFRFRVDGAGEALDGSGNFEYSTNTWIGMDVDLDNSLDVFLLVKGKTGAYTLRVFEGGGDTNTSPSTSSITNPTDFPTDLSPLTFGTDFHYDKTGTIEGYAASVDGVSSNANIDGDNNADFFVSFSMNFDAFSAVVNLKHLTDISDILRTSQDGDPVGVGELVSTINGGSGFDKNTAAQFVLATSTQESSFNTDIGGYDDKIDDNTVSFAAQGAFSPPLSFSNLFPVITSNGGADTASITTISGLSGTVITSVIATDANSDPIKYSVSGGADSVMFSIDAVNGSLILGQNVIDGVYVVTVKAEDLTDTLANGGVAIDSLSNDTQTLTVTVNAVVDIVAALAPSVDLLAASDTGPSNSDDITNDTTPTLRVTFDQSGTTTDVVVGDVVKLFNGATQVGTATVAAGDIVLGYVDITSSVLVAGSLNFTATVTDAASNVSGASSLLAIVLDMVAPVIALNSVSPLTIERAGGYLDPGATATDNVDTAAAITAAIVAVNSVNPDVAGTYTVTYDVSDAAGNAAVQVVRTVEVVDTVLPGVSILNQPASVNSLNAFNVTFKFTEVVNGFVDTDISISNATVSNFINVGGVGDTYTADIKPIGVGDVSVGVNANVAQDLSSNDNTAAVTQVTVFDNTPPDVAVTSFPAVNLANQSAYTVSGTCSAGDGDVLVLLSLGPAFFTPLESCTAGGTWSSTFDLSSLSDTAPGFMISIGARQTDAGGNVGNAVAVEVDKDTVRPGVQIQNVPAFVNADEFIVSFVFDEDVSGFDSGDIVVTNGVINLASFNAVDAQTYTVGISATADITINVAANVAQDLVGNGNDAATPASAVFDITAPVVTITVPAVVNAANDSSYTVTGTCNNGDGDVTVNIAGATLNPAIQDKTCTAGNWSRVFDVFGIADGINVIIIDASQTDAAGNTGNAATVQTDKDIVIAIPTVDLLTTNNATPVIGGSAEADSILTIVVAGATYTVTTDAVGLWTLDTATVAPDSGPFALPEGQNDVAVTSVDAAGNSATDATVNEITLTLDDDHDGIPNSVECPSGPPYDSSCTDTDGDGTPDFLEVDSDNDGIPDAVEAGLDVNNPIDSDGDGKPDYQDTDSDGDGIDDVIEGTIDTDGDGIPDYVDVGSNGDSDGDGIPDSVECTAYPACADTNGDGQPDYLDTDSDGDGIDDAVEAGIDPTAPIDTDGDGTPDYRDTDSDGDGTDDSVEGLTDNDGDGIPDYVDAASAGSAPNAGDSDGDGIADNIECELYPLCADSDNDGTPDYMEVDSDNDGIPDAVETGTANNDVDNDGIDNVLDVDFTGGLDLNNDGIDDTQPLDTDGDGIPDYQDTDSDADGIDDDTEGVIDTDADGIPDYLDADNGDASGTDITGSGDSDGDGISDADECLAGIPCADVDADGKPDYMDSNPDDGPLADFDNDGLLNYLDPDDDNDRIPDVVEDPNLDADDNPLTNAMDSDLDGSPDYLDLDSDADGLTDADESGASGSDADGDNIDDSYDIDITGGADLNVDGIDDNVTPRDTDGDNLPDYLDISSADDGSQDTDKDGIPDNVECPGFPVNCPDTDGDGTPDFLETDSDGDGLPDSDEKGSLVSGVLLDTDGDGLPDYRDLDSDSDGIPDASESLTSDGDNDAIPDVLDADSSGAPFGGDSDGDGVPDMDECNSYPNCADSNNDGTPDYMDANAKPYDQNAEINTGLNGAGSIGPWGLFILTLTLLFRRKITLVADK